MNSTATKMNANSRSMPDDSPWPVRKPRIVSSSRTRATVWPAARCLEIGERQSSRCANKRAPELDVDAVGGVIERVGPQILQDDIEKADRHEADHDYD